MFYNVIDGNYYYYYYYAYAYTRSKKQEERLGCIRIMVQYRTWSKGVSLGNG